MTHDEATVQAVADQVRRRITGVPLTSDDQMYRLKAINVLDCITALGYRRPLTDQEGKSLAFALTCFETLVGFEQADPIATPQIMRDMTDAIETLRSMLGATPRPAGAQQ